MHVISSYFLIDKILFLEQGSIKMMIPCVNEIMDFELSQIFKENFRQVQSTTLNLPPK